jgi:thiamine-monophosphate kinase
MSGNSPGGKSEVDEFDLIARLLRPLAANAPEALGLADDAAILPSRPGFDLVVSKDMLVEGTHFFPGDPLDLVARKLLRVNLSDLAAKGAEPYGYFLAVDWPRGLSWEQRALFVEGLARDQQDFGLKLFGGDTTSGDGALVASVTILGWVPAGGAVLRSGARPGDVVLVSGTIGDGWLGCQASLGALDLAPELIAQARQRYLLPQPRSILARQVARAAHGAVDISDGLIADLGHVARASGVAIDLHLERAPLSAAGEAYLVEDPLERLKQLVTGGDDYELALAVPPDRADGLIDAAAALGVPLTAIGDVREGQGVSVSYKGSPITFERTGYRHT